MQMAALLPPKWLTMDAAESDKKEKRNKVSSHANDDHQVLANEMQHPTLVLLFLFCFFFAALDHPNKTESV